MNCLETKSEGTTTQEVVTNVHYGIASVKDRGNCETSDIGNRRQIPANEKMYITGWKLHVIVVGLIVDFFTVQMESSITSTAVLDIADNLGG